MGWIIVFLPMALLFGFRDVTVGYDTQNYMKRYYQNGMNLESTREPLFHIFGVVCYILSGANQQFYLFSLALFILVFWGLGLEYWKKDMSFRWALFVYCSLFSIQTIDRSRQFIALSILFFGLQFLYQSILSLNKER